MLKQAHVYIKGDVIGVGFRAWTKIQAKLNNVTGWVKNNFNKPEIFGPGGGVEAVFQAEEKEIIAMIEKVKEGSPVSRVEDVIVTWQDAKEIIEGFEIKK